MACRIALLPAPLKPVLMRALLGHSVGRRVRIGLSLIHAERVEVGDDVVIGHGNVVWRTGHLRIGSDARIGHLNVIRGGAEVVIGPSVDILRRNEFNAIPDPVADQPVDSRLLIGEGAVVTTGHKIDFTDRVELGRRVILGGRNSSLWTHNRQQTAPIVVGDVTYLGSEVRVGPGVSVAGQALVGMGAVVVSSLSERGMLYGGVPARAIRPLNDEDLDRLQRPTRPG